MVAKVMAGRIPSSLDELLNVKDEIIDRELVLKGKFESEIKRLNQAKADAEEKIGIIATVEQAAQVRQEADEYAKSLRSETDRIHQNAKDELAAAFATKKLVSEKDASVTARENLLASKAQALADLQAGIDTKEMARRSDWAKNIETLDKRETALAKREAAYVANVAALAAREREFNERLDKLRI